MDFVSFNMNWYKNRIEYYETKALHANVTQDVIHEAKVMHKFLEDINDEDYHSTYELFQEKLQATKRLRNFIEMNNDKPFIVPQKSFIYNELSYSQSEIPLIQYLESDFMISPKVGQTNSITNYDEKKYIEILNFSRWVFDSIKPNTAVVFLLRDTLLPYLAFKYWNKDNTKLAVPLMIGRKYLSQFGNGDELYNRISDGVYTALYNCLESSKLFQSLAVSYIRESFYDNMDVIEKAKELLSSIQQPEICVVESGVHGTMPLLLKSCDERINSIKLYTTLPWLYDSWNGCFYTKQYENLRLFETLYCQDLLFTFSSLKDNSFFIREIVNEEIKKQSMLELEQWNNLIYVD